MPVPRDGHQEQQQWWRGACPPLEAGCAAESAAGEVIKPFGGAQIVSESQTLEVELFTLLGFGFALLKL